MANSSVADVEKQLHLARQNLLDLTMRNRILNYIPAKTRTIEILETTPAEIYDILVLQGKELELQSSSGKKSKKVACQTSLAPKEIQDRLFLTHQKAKTFLEEQGYSILFLALYSLEWYESKNSEKRISPVLLLPVELYRPQVGKAYKIKWTGEEIISNISLQAKLAEMNIFLPDFENPEDQAGIFDYSEAVDKSIEKKENWTVWETIYVDFFSFTKFVMYKDLEPEAWPEEMSPADHPLIQNIFNPSDSSQGPGITAEQINKLQTKDCFYVMDADPSQVAVIEDVKAGNNMVVEGPPGTGKSQTITNIIATMMAEGKSVLFVSEKMAALEVVKKRLDSVGLGEFCLELHSRKVKKREVIDELKRSISTPAPVTIDLDEKFALAEQLKEELDEYTTVLDKPLGKVQISAYQLYCLKEQARSFFLQKNQEIPRVRFSNPEECSPEELAQTKTFLTDFGQSLAIVQPVTKSPWNYTSPGLLLPSDQDDIAALVSEMEEALKSLENLVKEALQLLPLEKVENLQALEKVASVGELFQNAPQVSQVVLQHPEWQNPTGRPEFLAERVQKAQKLKQAILEKFETRVLEKDIATTVLELKKLSKKLLRFSSSQYRHLRWDIRFWYLDQEKRPNDEILTDLEMVAEFQQIQKEIHECEQEGKNYFGNIWQNEASDLNNLNHLLQWLRTFYQFQKDKILAAQAQEFLSTEVKTVSSQFLENLQTTKLVTQEKWRQLVNVLKMNQEELFGTDNLEEISLSSLTKQLQSWKENLNQVQKWSQFIAQKQECLQTIAAPIVPLLEQDLLQPEDLLPCFEGNFVDNLLQYAFRSNPKLAQFVAELHEDKVRRFSQIDKELIEHNQYRLCKILHQMRPQIVGGVSPTSEAGILLSEFNRKRGHMPIRKLMSLAGRLIQRIKPCFMMSPLSIAKFFDPRNVRFDMIIFDEASQVKPEDALGALLRGNQVVVMGDTSQLPPTSFFDYMAEGDGEEEGEIATITDMESVLHQCKRSFPTRTLQSHYRSKHESLIAISNEKFYNQTLTVYPSPFHSCDELGLQLRYLPETIYDRGKSTINREEAKAVAREAIEHYRKHPDKSLGIGTFNVKQQQAILKALEKELLQNPEVEKIIRENTKEALFVKNLETLQGDERDVMLLSMGYGFDKERKLSLNFGPLNQDGGERRLNVLISRAREKCVVFSNFRANDLKVEEKTALGVKVLQSFIRYAENVSQIKTPNTVESNSYPENNLAHFLAKHQYKTVPKVGCGNFRVDLAVVHPEDSGQYCLAVEFDNEKYYHCSVTRERERLRRQMLQSLGWKIHYVWFPEWYRNREECQKLILQIIQKARQEPLRFIGNNTTPSITTAETSDSSTITNIIRQASQAIDYEMCEGVDQEITGDLADQPTDLLMDIIERIVCIESPIHREDLIKRLREFWGLKRTNPKILYQIDQALELGLKEDRIKILGDFIWIVTMSDPPIRRRPSGLKLERICDEEIVQALHLILERQAANLPKDLIRQSSKLLGFKNAGRNVQDRFQKIIDHLVAKGQFKELANGMLDLAIVD